MPSSYVGLLVYFAIQIRVRFDGGVRGCNVVFDPFFTRKTPISENNSFRTPFFFTLFVLSHASDKHYFSKYWGTDACRSPPVNLSHYLTNVRLSCMGANPGGLPGL